jgi:FdhE protein
VGYIRDDPEVKGKNRLVCSFCASEWTFPRSTCAHCLKDGPEAVVFHSARPMNHVRVVECLHCRTYLKSVDLRILGKAVPLVEELATVEMDLWSRERGLHKVQHNLLAF